MEKYTYIGGALVFNVYAQLILKQRALAHSSTESGQKISYLLSMYTDIGVLSGLAAVLLGGILWTLALEKTGLGFAYPFMALSFVLIPAAAAFLFNEPLSVVKLFGLGLIVAGITVSAITQ